MKNKAFNLNFQGKNIICSKKLCTNTKKIDINII